MIASSVPTGDMLLFDFASSDKVGKWMILNDDVMGGRSTSELRLSEDGTAVFQGKLSLDNYGGFASVRTIPHPYDLGDYQGLALRVRGDGRRYKLRLRTDRNFDGPAYETGFDTVADKWTTVYVPFQEAVPTYRGQVLLDYHRLRPAEITQIGLMIADKRAGPFRIELAWVKAYRPLT